MIYHKMAIAAVFALSACAETSGGTSVFDQEAGVQVDGGNFGNATMNNMMAQTGQSGYTINLARRFATEVTSTVNFAFNSATLDDAARATLRQQADWIRQFPEVRFKVFGHTDLVGSNAYNRRLGLRRAQAVVQYLSTQGISRSRLEAVVSFGETRPIVQTTNMERRNRRTVTEVSGFVENHPMLLNGKYAEVIFREYVESATQRSTTTEAAASAGGGGQ